MNDTQRAATSDPNVFARRPNEPKRKPQASRVHVKLSLASLYRLGVIEGIQVCNASGVPVRELQGNDSLSIVIDSPDMVRLVNPDAMANLTDALGSEVIYPLECAITDLVNRTLVVAALTQPPR